MKEHSTELRGEQPSKTPRVDACVLNPLVGEDALSHRIRQAGALATVARQLERENTRLLEALREALVTINGLVEQQAMPDEWWKPATERIRHELGEDSRP